MQTTLNKIRSQKPCQDGWKRLLQHLGKTTADEESLPLLVVLNSNGLEDALWCLRAVDGHEKEMRLFAAWCARQVQHLMTDARSIAALDVAEKFALGRATPDELDAAGAAAWAAAGAAARAAAWAAAGDAAWDAARAAAWNAARAAAGDAAWDAARAAAGDAAWDAARAAAWNAARAAAWDAAWDAARAAARDAQEARLREILSKP